MLSTFVAAIPVELFRIGAGVSTPLGLLGLITIALLVAYRARLRRQEKSLSQIPPEQRIEVIDRGLRRYGLTAKNLSRDQKFQLLTLELEKRTRLVTISVIIGALVALTCFGISVLAWSNGRHESIDHSKPTTTEKVDHLSFDYMRLFGCDQVPLLLNYIYHVRTNPEYHLINFSTSEAYESFPYRNAQIIASAPLDLLTKCDLLSFASNGNKRDEDYVQLWRRQLEVDSATGKLGRDNGEGGPDLDPTVEDKAIYKRLGAIPAGGELEEIVNGISQRVGFFFLVIKNTSPGTLKNLELREKTSTLPNVFTTVYDPYRDGGSDSYVRPLDISQSFQELLRTPPVVQNSLDKASTNSLIVPRLEPGDSILWLLAIYQKDKDGFPRAYVGDVIEPISCTYTTESDGTLHEVPIRQPLMHKAAKILLPLGWHSQ